MRPAEEHRLCRCRVASGRGHFRQRGQPVQRHGGVKWHGVCVGSYK